MIHKDNTEKNNSKQEKLRYFCGGMKRVNLEDFDENGQYKYNNENSKLECNDCKIDEGIILALRRLGLLEDNTSSVTHSNDESI